jgi:hypothetical protein
MNVVLGFDDTVRLQYVHEVEAGQKSKLPKEDLKSSCEVNSSTSSTPKKMKTRTNAGETLSRLTDLESERNTQETRSFYKHGNLKVNQMLRRTTPLLLHHRRSYKYLKKN